VSSVSIVPIFATPFAVLGLPEAERLNAEVVTILEACAAADPDPASGGTPHCYRSRADLRLDDPPVQAVCREILRGMAGVVGALNQFSEHRMRELAMQTCLSFTIVRSNGSVPAHNYPLTSWCGIYCVEAPEPSADRRDSGVLRLHESRLQSMFSDATNAAMHLPYATGHHAWRPVPGRLAVFPGTTSHEIALLRSTGRLVLLTLRLRFVAPGQTGWVRW
jgi:hypothetical protein